MTVDKKTLKELYSRTLKVRKFEEKVWDLFGENLVPGTLHLYLGQEAVAAGVTAALKKTDWIQSTHRGHGHVVAKGADMNAALAELLGKESGSCKGKGGSMHITQFDVGAKIRAERPEGAPLTPEQPVTRQPSLDQVEGRTKRGF